MNLEFLRFVAVGVFNTATNYFFYAFLIFWGLWHVAAATLSFVFGVVFNYYTHGRFVFGHRSGRSFRRYVVSWLVIYVVNVSVLDLLVKSGVNSYLAGALLVPPMVLLAFVVMRYIVFSPKASTGENGIST